MWEWPLKWISHPGGAKFKWSAGDLNCEDKGNVTLVDGEPAVVAGSISRNEQLSLNGIPGLGAIPGINKVMVSNNKMDETDELLVVITPHIVDMVGRAWKFGCLRVGQ